MKIFKLFLIVAFGVGLNSSIVSMDDCKESIDPATSNHDNRENNSEEQNSNTQEKKEFNDEQSELLLNECGQDEPDFEAIKILLEKKADPNFKDEKQDTPLHLICDSENESRFDIIKELITYKAGPNAQNVYGKTPLHKHFEEGDSSLVFTSFILESDFDVRIKDNTGYTILHEICWNSTPSINVIKKIFESFINKKNEKILACLESKKSFFTYLLCLKVKQINHRWAKVPKYINFMILVPLAIEKNIREFLDIKDEDNKTPFLIAEDNKHNDVLVCFDNLKNALNKGLKALRRFLDQNNSEEQNSNTQEKKEFNDEQSELLLNECGQDEPDFEAIKILLEKKADPNFKDEKQDTPLHLICDSENESRFDIIKELITYKAGPNAQNIYGKTPLHKHFEEGDSSLAFTSFILESDFDVRIKDNTGYTILHEICWNSTPSINVIKKIFESFINKKNEKILACLESKKSFFTYLLCLKVKQINHRWAKVPKYINFMILVPLAIEKNICEFLDIKDEYNKTPFLIAEDNKNKDVLVCFDNLKNALNKGLEALRRFLDQNK